MAEQQKVNEPVQKKQKEFVDDPYTEENWFHVPEDDPTPEPTPDPNAQPIVDPNAQVDPNLVKPEVDPNVQPQPDPNQPVLTEAQKAMQQMSEYQPLVDLYQNDPSFQQHVEGYVNRNMPRPTPQQPQPFNPQGFPQPVNPYQVAQQQMPNMQMPVNPYTQPQYPNQYGDPVMPQQPQQMPQQPAQMVAQQMQLPKPPEDFEPYQMTDPATKSGQWFGSVLNNFGDQIGNRFAQQMEQQNAVYGQQLEELRLQGIQRDAEEQQFNQFLSSRPDLDMRSARQFWDWASNPNNVTIDHLYNLYGSINQQPQQQNQQQQNLNQQPQTNPLNETLNRIRQNQQYPQTSVNVNQQVTDEPEGDKFLKGMGDHMISY